MTDEQLDVYLDKILRAAGSALKHYSMQKTKDDMRQALREALAQPEQEPVAWTEQRFYDDGTPNPCSALKWAGRNDQDDFPVGTKFYTTPPQRKPLTDEQIKAIHFEWMTTTSGADTLLGFARAIEAFHGIGENK